MSGPYVPVSRPQPPLTPNDSLPPARPPLPWFESVGPRFVRSQPWLVELNNVYARLNVSEEEIDHVVSRYHRQKDMVLRVIRLRDGHVSPPRNGGFHPSPQLDGDVDNATVFIGGISPQITSALLKILFLPFGDISYVKVPTGKSCAFVRFEDKAAAKKAIECMQGFTIDGSSLRTSWGKPTNNERSPIIPLCTPHQAARLRTYLSATEAQSVLTAIDTIFDGSLDSFVQGLHYLVSIGSPAVDNHQDTMQQAQPSEGPDPSTQQPALRAYQVSPKHRLPRGDGHNPFRPTQFELFRSNTSSPRQPLAILPSNRLNAAAQPFNASGSMTQAQGDDHHLAPHGQAVSLQGPDPHHAASANLAPQISITSDSDSSDASTYYTSDSSNSPPNIPIPTPTIWGEHNNVNGEHGSDPSLSEWIHDPASGMMVKVRSPPAHISPIDSLSPSRGSSSASTTTPISFAASGRRNRQVTAVYMPSLNAGSSVPARASDIAGVPPIGAELARRRSDPVVEASNPYTPFASTSNNGYSTPPRSQASSFHYEGNEAVPGHLLGGNSVFAPRT